MTNKKIGWLVRDQQSDDRLNVTHLDEPSDGLVDSPKVVDRERDIGRERDDVGEGDRGGEKTVIGLCRNRSPIRSCHACRERPKLTRERGKLIPVEA